MTRRCSVCKQVKDISQFHKNGKQKSGRLKVHPECKTCRNKLIKRRK